MGSVAIYRDPLFKQHMADPYHPESPSRLVGIDEMIEAYENRDQLIEMTGRDATHEELGWVHTETLIRTVEESSSREWTAFDYETGANSHSYAAAARAAGSAIHAIDTVVAGEVTKCSVFSRPPGHHAERNRVMGFCLFNNIAVAAEYALRKHGMDRVFIFDWDVHHGNGTMHSFYDTDRILYASTHQSPHYPGTGMITETGEGSGIGHTVNIPFPAGTGDNEYWAVLEQILVPIILQYKPDLMLISAGYDAHQADPLAGMLLTSAMYGDMTALLARVADEVCGGRLVLILEGGYQIDALAESNSRVLSALCGNWTQRNFDGASYHAVDIIQRLGRELGGTWTGLGTKL